MATMINTFVNAFSNRLEAPVRQHLKNVYACLSLSTVTAAAGACGHLYTDLLQANMLTTLGSIALLLRLSTLPDNGKNPKLRLCYLLGFAFLSGIGLHPLLELVVTVNPSIIVTALMGTTVVFVSFSISALLAERGSWLYLSGTLVSLLNVLVMLAFVNAFLHWSILYEIDLYAVLFLVCGFVIYDTQLIIEKFHAGSKDFVLHSFDLFIDFLTIFRQLLIILTKKELSKERKQRKE
ncbi:probable Bax inhibitor 1 [Colletes gigas]|uniref:probable Bax inhibitor 1 n=1 Tax=Colletes gigas TaxID=935657 RepID=UPI001C9BAEED|nr:probable Bax inhibitor 1 [Colletes gigas]